MAFRTINLDCVNCIFDCVNSHCSTGKCPNHKERVDKQKLRQLNNELRYKHINMKKLCKENHLKQSIMSKMLKGKMDFNYKYLVILERYVE